MLQHDLASGRTATEASREADARREANRRRREEEAAAEVKNPVMVRKQPVLRGKHSSLLSTAFLQSSSMLGHA